MAEDDRELVERARGGDEKAFGALVEEYKGIVVAAAYSVTGDPEAARDIAQETFLDAYRILGTLRAPEKFGSWVWGIARRKAIYWVRKERRRSSARLSGDPEGGPSVDPADGLVLEEKKRAVLDAVWKLPKRYREVVVLRYIDEKPYDQIARILGLSPATVDKRLFRARVKLRTLLRGMER